MITTKKNDNSILDTILSAPSTSNYNLSEDIHDQHGNLLLSKGRKITREIKEKLSSRILKQPLEMSITSENSVTSEEIYLIALSLIKETPFLSPFAHSLESYALDLKLLRFEALPLLLLTVLKDSKPESFRHAIILTLIANLIGRQMNLPTHDIENLTVAGLLHDIGELYYSTPQDKTLDAEDWSKIMTHPILGSSVIKNHMKYPDEVSTAVLEHHERADQSGYPRKVNANTCSIIGQIIIVAEAVTGILSAQTDLQRALIVLKLTINTYPAAPVTALFQLASEKKIIDSPSKLTASLSQLKYNALLLGELKSIINDINEASKNKQAAKEVSTNILNRIERLNVYIADTGVFFITDENSIGISSNEQTDNIELLTITKEIKWQIQDIIRDAILRYKFLDIDCSVLNNISMSLNTPTDI